MGVGLDFIGQRCRITDDNRTRAAILTHGATERDSHRDRLSIIRCPQRRRLTRANHVPVTIGKPLGTEALSPKSTRFGIALRSIKRYGLYF
jgi:hypothetical protein